MKTLQNNYTTPEQSKRLLELGVPADSADCIGLISRYDKGTAVKKGDIFRHILRAEDTYTIVTSPDERGGVLVDEPFPIWSVGRLIEIIGKTRVDMHATTFVETSASDMLLQVIGRLEALVLNNNIDFSKLED